MESKLNNTRQFLGVDETWVGLPEVTSGFANIAVNIVSTQNLTVIVYQSLDGRIFDFQDNYIFDTALVGTQTTFQIAVKALFVKVSVLNVSVNDINNLVITTVFINTSRDSSILQPDVIAGSVEVLNGIKATDYEFNTLRDVACDDTGHLLVNINSPTTSTGDLIINGSSSSATRHVYLMIVNTWYRVASVGNTPGHVWNSIGAIVGDETIPTVGRLFKCLSVPGNIEGQGTVYDVEYSDSITATPVGTQDVNIVSTITVPVSGSVALLPAVDPTLTVGTVRLTDTYGSSVITSSGNLMVGINNIYTVNPLHTIVDSGSVAVSSLPAITLSKTTSSITTYENPSLIISFDSGNTVRDIKTSAGSLQSLSLVNNNNAIGFISLYNLLAADVNVATSIPIAVIVVQKDQAIQLVTHNLAFSTALSFFTSTAYGGATALTNVYLTALYDN
mgnify:CR=1 FL=1